MDIHSKVKTLNVLGISFLGLFIILMVSSVLISGAVGNYQSETNLYFFGSILFLAISIFCFCYAKNEDKPYKYLPRD